MAVHPDSEYMTRLDGRTGVWSIGSTGVWEHWCMGVLEYWCIGVLMCRNTGVWEY